MYKVRKTKMHDGTIYLVQKLRQRILLKKSAMSPIIFLSMFTSTKSSFSLQKKKKEKKRKTKHNEELQNCFGWYLQKLYSIIGKFVDKFIMCFKSHHFPPLNCKNKIGFMNSFY